MTAFVPPNPDFKTHIESSFAKQPYMAFIGASLDLVDAGAVDISLAFRPELSQQYGFVHGGVITAIADAAAAYAALTLAPPGHGVLTTELKVNFLRPATTHLLRAQGRVIKPGRSLTIGQADVYEQAPDGRRHVQTGLLTMMFAENLKE